MVPEPEADGDLGGRRRSARVREIKARRPPTPVSDSPPTPPPPRKEKKEKTPKKVKKEKEVKKKRGRKGQASESPSDEDDLSELNESDDDGMWLVTQKTLLDDDFTPEEDSGDEDFKPRGRNFQRQASRASKFINLVWFGRHSIFLIFTLVN